MSFFNAFRKSMLSPKKIFCISVFLFLNAQSLSGPLPSLGAQQKFSVSGLSSGGYMAAQFAVAFSKEVDGLGVMAGGPYACSQSLVWQFEASLRCACLSPLYCSKPTSSILAHLGYEKAEGKESLELIDPLKNLANQRVWLFSGEKDKKVPKENVEAIKIFYEGHVKLPSSHLRYDSDKEANHGMPTPQGEVPCDKHEFPYLNKCGQRDSAKDILSWIYGPLLNSSYSTSGRLMEFDQYRYIENQATSGLAEKGFVYIPPVCDKFYSGCRIHVAFHGCQQAHDFVNERGEKIGEKFITLAGYNEWAENNRIIVLYPQVKPQGSPANPPLSHYQYNPHGCWDFWGYTSPAPSIGLWATKAGSQLKAVYSMVKALQQ